MNKKQNEIFIYEGELFQISITKLKDKFKVKFYESKGEEYSTWYIERKYYKTFNEAEADILLEMKRDYESDLFNEIKHNLKTLGAALR